MGYTVAQLVLGAAAFALVLSWWERGEGPPSQQSQLVPWAFARLLAGLCVMSALALRGRAPTLLWAMVPAAAFVLAPWQFARLLIGLRSPLAVGAAHLAPLAFDGRRADAVYACRVWLAWSQRDQARLGTLVDARAPGQLRSLAEAASLLCAGRHHEAAGRLDAAQDFADAPPSVMWPLITELEAAAESVDAGPQLAIGDVSASLAPLLRPLEGELEPALMKWRERWSQPGGNFGPKVAMLHARFVDELRALSAPAQQRAFTGFGSTLVELEHRLEKLPQAPGAADLSLEWETWLELRAALSDADEAQAALRLAAAEPALIALAAKAWRSESTRAFAAAVLNFLERRATDLQDHRRAERARRNLSLVA